MMAKSEVRGGREEKNLSKRSFRTENESSRMMISSSVTRPKLGKITRKTPGKKVATIQREKEREEKVLWGLAKK